MVFVLDNYDSFTYNLVQYLGELGTDVVVRRNDQITVGEVETLHPERIVISPGPCTPQEAGISINRWGQRSVEASYAPPTLCTERPARLLTTERRSSKT
jgi:anthranilate/para-aminobenzoate synthase component II